MTQSHHADTVATGLTDATPIHIKRGKTSGSTREIRVIEPASVAELEDVVRRCAQRGDRYTVVGGQSNVVGALDTDVELAISTRGLRSIRSFDPESHLVTVEAGLLGGELEQWLNERDCTLGQYPQSLYLSTIGGWVNTRAIGSHSARNGGIEDALRGAVIVLADGQRLTFSPRARPAGGFDGLAAFLGSEGSLGVIAEVTLEVQTVLPEASLCFAFESMDAVIEAQRTLIQHGYPVALLRGYNVAESNHVLGTPSGTSCLLMVSTVGAETLVPAQRDAIAAVLGDLGGRQLDSSAAQRWYAERYRVETMMEDRNSQPGCAFDTIEVSVPWASAAKCAQEMETAMGKHSDPFYLHFSHAYETGVCFYSLLWLNEGDDHVVRGKLREVWDEALSIVERQGGTIGHHHGIGAVRAPQYSRSADFAIHRVVKDAIDPSGHLVARLLQ